MKFLPYIFISLLLIFHFQSFSQVKQAKITGKIIDAESKTPLEFATVSFQDSNNPDFLTGGVSDAAGNIAFEVPTGTYHIKVEFLSFKTHKIDNQVISTHYDLGTIALALDAAAIEGVEIVAEKTTTEYHLDKKVFNVGKDLTSKGGSVVDVLQNVPSVTVGAEGSINLRGNGNVRVLINGKPSMLANNNGLDQIPANSIERVEVITNPSARYEAQGSAGIINIVLKKNSLSGFSGSIQTNVGFPGDFRPTLSLNYKTKKLNLFSTVGYRYSHYNGEMISTQQTTQNGTSKNLFQTIDQDRFDNSSRLYFGGDYSFDEKNTLTLSLFRYQNNNRDWSYTNYNFSDEFFQPTSNIARTVSYREPQIYNQWELNYDKTFNKKGQKLRFTMEYDFWDDDENERIKDQETFPTLGTASQIRSRDIESSKDFLIQSDYVLPLSEQSHLEMGARGETRIITSDYLAQRQSGNDWETIGDFDNELDYYEKIASAYVQYGKKLDKFSYLIGLRSEYTAIRIEDIKNLYQIEKNYLRFFPSLHLSYQVSEDQTMQLSYSRRINRPGFWQLNPFGGVSDFRNLRGGNPDLNPAYTNSLEFGMLYNKDKFSFNPAVYYQFTTDYFFSITEQLADGNFFNSPTNQSQESRWGLELAASFHPLKWWTLSGDFNFYQIQQEGSYKELDLKNTNETWFARINSRMNLPKSLNVQATVNYQGRNQNAQTTRKALIHADFALSKDLLKEKATITFNLRNAFNSRRFRWTTVGENFWLTAERASFGRRWSATFAYRFNQKKNQRARRPSSGNR